MAGKKGSHDQALKELRAYGLAYPGAETKSPWPEHLDLVVKGKTFAFLSVEGVPLSISCKLPQSSEAALMWPFAKPTAYGLGKSGWVSAQFTESEQLPVGLLREWIDESYRAQAPKKLVAQLTAGQGGAGAPVEVKAKPAVKKPAAKKPAAKKPAVKKSTAKKALKKKAAKAR